MSRLAIGFALLGLTGWVPASRSELCINEINACNIRGAADEDGDCEDWIELYNSGPEAVDLEGYFLSDDPADPFKWSFSDAAVQPGDFLPVFCSGKDRAGVFFHTNFEIASDGEILTLTGPGGGQVDQVFSDSLRAEISRGRQPDGGPLWYYFAEPSFAAANAAPGYLGYAPPPAFSAAGGFYDGPFSVEISAPSPAARITYTLDAGDPSPASELYAAPISIGASKILRACAFADSLLPSRVVSASYFLGEACSLPVVSVVTDPANLWDAENGIYVLGDDYDPEYPHFGANFWEDWERPAHLEIFETDGSLVLDQNIGIKIHGTYTRALPQKSLQLIARDGYGDGSLSRRLFSDKPITDFKHLLLRNAGSDWCVAHYRDGFAQRAMAGSGLDLMAYRPAIAFLNGEYWGIQNLREHMDAYYLRDNHGMDVDEVDLIKNHDFVLAGDKDHYQAMIDYVAAHDLAEEEPFAYVQTQLDTDNFATYCAYEIFFANYDWPGNNVKCWRPRSGDGRWRWMVYDLDFGLGLAPWLADAAHNTLAQALAEDGPDYPNPPYSTFLLRKLMANEVFRRDFINRYAELMSTKLDRSVLSELHAEILAPLAPEMARHMERWGFSYDDWLFEVDRVQDFIDQRGAYAREHVMAQFGLPDTLLLGLDIDPPGAGTITLTSLSVDSTWSGVYFQGNPIRLTAVPRPGWSFAAWSGADSSEAQEILISPTGAAGLIANFSAGGPGSPTVLINEINYHSPPDFDAGDWVEFHNPGQGPMDMSGWRFLDSEDLHAFIFPSGTVLPAGGYLVLCRDLDRFRALFPAVGNVIGKLDFGFSGSGELLRLHDAADQPFDVVEYSDRAPWPVEANGGGSTLELIDPWDDNNRAGNWAASRDPAAHGTPGEVNSVYLMGDNAPPGSLRLEAAYPNPFNPATTLIFSLPAAGKLRLSVHDVRGREVALLWEGFLPAGRHERKWRAEGLASGIYLARLAAGDKILSRKLLLLR